MSGRFSNPNLKSVQKAVFDASVAVQTYVSSILQQADITLKEMPTLPTHQKTARTHALSWSNHVLPGIVDTNSDIIDSANRFTAYYDVLVKLADKVATDPTARGNFITGLTYLRNSISEKVSKTKVVVVTLKSFKDKLTVDYSTFSSDENRASKVYEGQSGEIASLSKQIDNTQAELNKLIGVMSGGAVGVVSGVVVILVGSFAEIETAVLSSGLIVSGVGLLVGGITSEITGGVEYGLKVDTLVSLKEKLAKDKQGLVALKTVKGQLDGFVSQLTNAIAAMDNLIIQWTTLEDGLNQVLSDVGRDSGTTGPRLRAMLDEAKQDWEAALELAKKLQPNGRVAVQKVNRIQDVIHTGS